ncbi:MAG: SPASM domain-containing protein [Candidatus Aureabacteria bacterium]|nr:SPASM domain-containing protein [Candidatus Auribacterota bacterium]
MYSAQSKLQNEDLLWQEVNKRCVSLNHLPPRLTLQTHQRCNFSCKFCYHFINKYYHHRDPSTMEAMDPNLLLRIADELFPTLQYYEATLLGEPFLSPHFETELDLCRKYGVFFRPTTNASLLTEKMIEKVDGAMDWLKCSFDSHIRGIYHYLKIGARYETIVKNLKTFSRKREQMRPVPFFRVGFVLNDLNMDTLPEYMIWCHEELGVDDIEVMGLNVDHSHIEPLQVFDQAQRVNSILEKAIQTAIEKKIRLTLPFLAIPDEKRGGGESLSSRTRAVSLRKQQQEIGFVPPRNFDKMSYIMRNRRNYWNFGDLGYVWCHDFRRQDVCEEFFNRPFIIWNGNVEACGNCNTFMPGNVRRQSFREIWNSELYQDIRRRMYEGPVQMWYKPCQSCICMFVTYNRATSDHRFASFYRILHKGGKEVPKGDAELYWMRDTQSEPRRAPQGMGFRIKQMTPPRLWNIARGVYHSLTR